jgi:mannose-6-phosphate isomerase-like protein (cupin superfamily)
VVPRLAQYAPPSESGATILTTSSRPEVKMRILEGADRFTSSDEPNHWVEHFRNDDLSVGTYSIPAGSVDDQTPHTEDEIYVVLGGRARIVASLDGVPVEKGSVVFVPAGEEHRFVDITEDLTALVFFAPAEGARAEG